MPPAINYSAGGRSAELDRSRKELLRLRHERDRLANRIAQRIVNGVNRIRVSYPGIRFSHDAAETARANLDLVTHAYGQGVKSIIELIYAQNQALVANQQAAHAVYDFVIDLIYVQRGIGDFSLFSSREERNVWLERLEQHQRDH